MKLQYTSIVTKNASSKDIRSKYGKLDAQRQNFGCSGETYKTNDLRAAS